MKARELREKPLEELRVLVEDEKRNIFGLRMQRGMGQLKQRLALSSARKKLARMLTIIGERERAEKQGEGATNG